jgi:Putative Flp pilus-assembly TadE/G-like
MTRLREERGQALVVSVVFMIVLVAMTAFVLDIGSWFRAQRAAQAAADASALAGAQSLPASPPAAVSDAVGAGTSNGGGVAAAAITISSNVVTNDTIKLKVSRKAPGFFAQVFGVASVDVGASAAARSFKLGEAKYVAPIAVNIKHPMLSGPGCPDSCYGRPTTLPLDKAGAPGAFDMIILDQDAGKGGVATGILADWIENGFDGYLDVDEDYYSDPGSKFNSSQIQAALDSRLNTELLFPVYDVLYGNGSNAEYHVVAWAAFYLTGYDISGKGSLSGYFKSMTWAGIETTAGNQSPYFGVHGVALVQ